MPRIAQLRPFNADELAQLHIALRRASSSWSQSRWAARPCRPISSR
jgi:hypothetical protein